MPTFEQQSFYEFFAGVGLVRSGLENTGWQCVWANDICKKKESTYAKNFDGDDFHCEDIWNIIDNIQLLPQGAFLSTASFPCTDLSVAGGRKGLKGKQSGTLLAFLEIMKSLKKINANPPVLMLENVQGFLSSHNGKDVADTVEFLNKLDYVVDLIEVDARHFTPQSRPRVFLFAVISPLAKKVMKLKPQIEDEVLSMWWQYYDKSPLVRSKKIKDIIRHNDHLSWGLFDLPDLPMMNQTLENIVETLSDDEKNWWETDKVDKILGQMSEKHLKTLNAWKHENKFSYGTLYRRMRNKSTRAELRSDGLAGCLRTPKGGSSKQILVKAGLGKIRFRLLTPREYARLQGVKDQFVLPDNITDGYFAMGDAVCVPLIDWLSKNILLKCFEAYHEKTHKYVA